MTSYQFWIEQSDRWFKCVDEGSPITAQVIKNAADEKSCSSLCYPDEPCSLTADGKCQEGLR
jgi:hypothetical protein